jgi:uncharacterized protein (DUF2147 family)
VATNFIMKSKVKLSETLLTRSFPKPCRRLTVLSVLYRAMARMGEIWYIGRNPRGVADIWEGETMMRVQKFVRLVSFSALIIGGGIGAASAADPAGTWLRDTGASRVRFAKCGEAWCGSIIWLKDANGPAKVGQRIFYDMKPAGENKWEGKAFNPEDGKTYSGKMTLSGANLTTAGCALGGFICRSVSWAKVE